MKKALSVIVAFLIIVLSLTPIPASAKDLNNGEGMFEVSVPIEADAYMLVCLDDDNVLAQKNKDKVKYPASLTKIVTAMVTIENVKDLDKTVTVSEHAVSVLEGTDAQVAGLAAGEKVTYSKLLSLTMVHSACDACQVLAEAIGGDEAGFVRMMNDWAKKCGCKNTHFVNPDGLHDDNHYTTASDMYLITRAALKNSTFVQVSTAKSVDYNGVEFVHTNYMLHPANGSYYYKYAQGIKTGTTTQAGNCVITKADKGGKNYLAVVLDSPTINEMKGSFVDAKALFEWGYNDLKEKVIFTSNEAVSDTNVLYGRDCDKLDLCANSDLSALVPTDAKQKDFKVKLSGVSGTIEAPIEKGETVCKAQILYKGKVVAVTTLVAAEDVKLDVIAKIGAIINAGFSKRPFLNVLCLIVVFALLIFVIRVIRVSKMKKKQAAAYRAKRRERIAKEKRETGDSNDYFNL